MKRKNHFGASMMAILLGSTIMAMSAYGVDPSYVPADNAITNSINESLKSNEITKKTNIKITTEKGVVKLNGVAKNATEAIRVIQIAGATEGVKEVDTDRLKIADNSNYFSDVYITGKVKGLLLKNDLIDDSQDVSAMNLHVETANGIVYLSGHVGNDSQKQQAEDIAKSVKGVKRVQSYITVSENK